jgi:hypothetical protein
MPTNAERQRAHKARMAEAGFRQLQLWVPPGLRSRTPPRGGVAASKPGPNRLLKKSLAIATIERKESQDGRRRIDLAPNGFGANQACAAAQQKPFFSSLLSLERLINTRSKHPLRLKDRKNNQAVNDAKTDAVLRGDRRVTLKLMEM